MFYKLQFASAITLPELVQTLKDCVLGNSFSANTTVVESISTAPVGWEVVDSASDLLVLRVAYTDRPGYSYLKFEIFSGSNLYATYGDGYSTEGRTITLRGIVQTNTNRVSCAFSTLINQKLIISITNRRFIVNAVHPTSSHRTFYGLHLCDSQLVEAYGPEGAIPAVLFGHNIYRQIEVPSLFTLNSWVTCDVALPAQQGNASNPNRMLMPNGDYGIFELGYLVGGYGSSALKTSLYTMKYQNLPDFEDVTVLGKTYGVLQERSNTSYCYLVPKE